MIVVKNISKKYRDVCALKAVNLEFGNGIVSGVLGPNGCGKTTLIKTILGLVIPDDGSIEIDGEMILNSSQYREGIGYLPQNPQFPINLTAEEIFCMLEDLRGYKAKKKDDLIELFELERHLKKPTGQLSGGTRQKVSATIAFMFDPKILILDEPTVGLDPLAVVRLKELIHQEVKSGKSAILVTHMLAEIEQLVEKMYFLLDGSVRFSGSLNEIRKEAGTSELDQAVVRLMAQGQNAKVNT